MEQELNNPSRVPSRNILAFWYAGIALLGIWGYYIVSGNLSHDAAILLVFTQQLMEGRAIYDEMLNMQPPFWLYFNMIPLAIGERLGLSVNTSIHGFYSLIAIGSMILSWRLLGQSSLIRSRPYAREAILACICYGFFWFPYGDFCQRIHICYVCLTPYFLSSMLHLRNERVGLGMQGMVGLLAVIGTLAKPHYVVFMLVGELVLAIVRRRLFFCLRLEVLLPALCNLIHYALLLLLWPQWLEVLVPVTSEWYAAIRPDAKFFHGKLYLVLWLPAFIALMWCSVSRKDKARSELFLFVGWIAAAFFVMYVQGFGYGYFQLLARFMTLLMGAYFLILFRSSRFVLLLLPLFILFTLIYTKGITALTRRIDPISQQVTQTIRAYEPAGKSVMWIAPNNWPFVNSVLDLGMRFTAPNQNFIFLNGLGLHLGLERGEPFPEEAFDQLPEGVDFLLTAWLDRFIEEPPDFVFVTEGNTHRLLFYKVDLLDFLQKDERFRKAWSQYEKIDPVEGAALYRRKGGAK